MLYYNKEQNKFGYTIGMLRNIYPNVSIPDELTEFDGWIAYSETTPPQREYSIAIETEPVDGIQTWKLEWSSSKDVIYNAAVSSIDNAVAEVRSTFDRFRDEYYKREAEAKEYVDGQYKGTPGTLLKTFADNASLKYDVAAGLILKQSAMLRQAYEELSNLRMSKYSILEKEDDIETIINKRNQILQSINEIAVRIRT